MRELAGDVVDELASRCGVPTTRIVTLSTALTSMGLLVREGDRVEKGDLLLRLSDAGLGCPEPVAAQQQHVPRFQRHFL